MFRESIHWSDLFERKGALWRHDGNPEQPHALLTSGKHSSGFFNGEIVMEDAVLLEEVCSDLAELLDLRKTRLYEIDRVVGPAMGAITLAHEIARRIGHRRGYRCLRAYTEKEVVDGRKLMVFQRTALRPAERVLLVEDVITSGDSVELTAQAVVDAGGVVLPYVLAIVNRSGLTAVNGKKIICLLDRFMPAWVPDECPLCKQGSQALRPKDIKYWATLNAAAH